MLRSVGLAVVAALVVGEAAGGQVLEQTLVPGGRFRLQLAGAFDHWDSRFGRADDGSERVESLDDDLTDPTSLSLFPGISTLGSIVGGVTGMDGYAPVLGSTTGRVTQDVSRIDFGGHLGVFDWLTVGVVVPWMQTRTAADVYFAAEAGSGDLGLNPVITDEAAVSAFLGSTESARTAAESNASTVCAGGASPECAAAEDLAARVSGFDASLLAAYTASPFFVVAGTEAGDALMQAASTLSADLAAAGLSGLAPMAMADGVLDEEGFAALQTARLEGFGMAPLETRQSLWGTGDTEVSARLRLLGNRATSPDDALPGFGYRISAHFLARLPTGRPADPDVPLDIGLDDAQTDLQGGLHAALRFGRRVGLTAGGYYGIQRPTTLTKRVAEPERVLAPLETRHELRWNPGSYVGFGVAPSFHLSSALTLAGEYRYFEKRRDSFSLVSPDAGVDPMVLELESGVKAHMVGGGIRYDTVLPWMRGVAPRPLEIHVRLLSTVAGSGGQVPKITRVEAGARIFRRLWGEER